jgi:hypothetical protein
MSAGSSPSIVPYNQQNAVKPKPLLPLSLLSLAAVLDGVADWVLVDGNVESDPLEAVDRALRDTHASVLGVTVMPDPEEDVEGTIDFIKRVKRINARSEIIMYMYTPVPLSGELYEQANSWRWATGRYEMPLELRVLHRLMAYQRPETTGF